MPESLPKEIVYLDLFSGTGGFALGLQQAGFVFEEHYFSEIDKYAAATYQYNFKNAKNLGDIKGIGGKKIPKPDIITFGSPCQDVSNAGKREGIKGKRSGLFFEAVRLIRACRPRVFIFENVKGLFSSNGGKDFEAVLRAFADIGLYDLQWQLLNTAWFLPQNRERIYLVGHLRGTARPQIFPIGESTKLSEAISKEGQNYEDIASAITSNYSKGVHGRGETYVNVAYRIPEGTKKGYATATEGDSINLSFPSSRQKRGRVGKGTAHTLDTGSNQYTVHKGRLRRLTPLECERLQGFHDNWTAQGLFANEITPISDTQRYHMLGNAVSVAVVKAVAFKLLKCKTELGDPDTPYPIRPEIVLGGTIGDIDVPELSITFSRNGKPFLGTIKSSRDVAEFIRTTFNDGELEAQEHFIVLYLNTRNGIIGYYRHTRGSINTTLADIRIVLAVGLKCLATGIIVAHNHPSDVPDPSNADEGLTKQLKAAGAIMNIELKDHVIVTVNHHYSFAEKGLLGLQPLIDNREKFILVVQKDLLEKKHHTKTSLERIAAYNNINDQTEVKELIELAIVITARSIAHDQKLDHIQRFKGIVELYNSQVNLSHRTSQSILLQQYSTPAPIGYLMGIFCGVNKPGIYLEPCAGNGMLTIAADPKYFCVNEIDAVRLRNLQTQSFRQVISTDANSPNLCTQFSEEGFDAVLTNPPFGIMDTKVIFDRFEIQPLEHVMALRALGCMKDKGKAAIIIGGHTAWDTKGRIQAGKNRVFFNYLYSHYYIADVILINGRKLYSRQGTSFNTRLILIKGKKEKVEGAAPVFDKSHDVIINSFDELFARVMDAMDNGPEITTKQEQQEEALFSTYAIRYSEQYLPLLEKQENAMLFLRNGKDYEVFGDNADFLVGYMSRPRHVQFIYQGKKISLFRIPVEEMDWLLDKLKRTYFKVIMSDKMEQPANQQSISSLESEALNLFNQLQARGLGSAQTQYSMDHETTNRHISDSGTDHGLIPNHDDLFEQFNKQKDQDSRQLYLFQSGDYYYAFNEDAEQVSRVCKIRMVKSADSGAFRYYVAAISKPYVPWHLAELKEVGSKPVVVYASNLSGNGNPSGYDHKLNGLLGELSHRKQQSLGAPYMPSSNACVVLDTQVPDSMAYETQEALATIKEAVGGDVDNFVRDRLGYKTKTALCKALSAEQTDAVMMGIYNIEARGQGMIIGDQTGIGKGRVAAAMIRYACHEGLKPVFLTEKANLFSDIYRDLYAIGSGHLKPFIVNGRESKTDIKDEDGDVIYQALPYHEQQTIFSNRKVPASYDFVVATYSQFNSPDKKPEKPAFLSAIAADNIFIMDEAHNSSGSSNTGLFLQGVISRAIGVIFLSATFAKRPDNMPIYAMKTAISDCNMSRDDLVESIQRGGVALQEVLSSQLVAEGQMLRRERSFEGVEVNYITLTEKAQEHQAIADNITGIVRDIILFQSDFINVIVEELDTIAVGESKEVSVRNGTSEAGVDNTPYFSKVFNIINQMLFSLKALSVAEQAIERLQEGKKPIIAFSSTMGSFLEDMEDERGLPVSDGSTIDADFSEVLRRGLDGVMRYTEKDTNGEPEYKKFEVSELSPEGQAEYHRIKNKIEEISTGITLSPIDVVVKKIRDAGYSVAEVTGRKFELQMNATGAKALVMTRRRINTNDAFRQFNNNEVDVLMINQSGSTGASAHAVPTAKVTRDQVKQRVMIVLQAELDINTEVQKRGRVNRTGQIMKPIYDYVTSAIPAENRLMMMLQKKLKSLDANTASNQKQSVKILDVPDFLNKYGDKVVKEYLLENEKINRLLDDPLRLKNKTDSDSGETDLTENAAHKVSGRVAVLSVKMQQEFYAEITDRYNDYVSYLQQVGEYDLELEAMNLQAETLNSKIVKMGKGSGSTFSEDSILETVKANVLKKPFTEVELENLLAESTQGEDPKKLQADLIKDYDEETGWALELEEKELQAKYDEMDKRIYTEKKFQKLKTQAERDEYERTREQQIEEARKKAVQALRGKAVSRMHYLEKIFKFFYIGRNLNYPIDNFNGYKEYVPTVFLGFLIDWKRKNPFTPSQIKLRFALANSSKYFAMPASYDDVDIIVGASHDLPELTTEHILRNWNTYIQENNTDRKTRHIITGNLLQAFSDFKGKLVNYSTIDGKITKGILMPENWAVDEQVQDKVSIPIIKALPIIKSLVPGRSITSSTGIGFLRQMEIFKIIVPMSRKAGGDVYLDKQLLALVENNNFERVSDKMVAKLNTKDIDAFVEIIQNSHSCSIIINRHQFSTIEKQAIVLHNRKPIRLPEPEKEYKPGDHIIDLLELEAEALELQLRLLAA